MKGLLDEVIVYYQKVIKINFNCGKFYYSLGNVLVGKNYLDEVVVVYYKVIEFNFNVLMFLYRLGNVLIQ